MLTPKEKEDIYLKLSSSFSLNTSIPMASVALYLKNIGIDYQEKGYKKLKNLLKDLNFIELSETNNDDKHNEFVLIKEKKERLNKKISLDNIKRIEDKFYNDLIKKFKFDIKYPISKISLFVNDSGYNYQDYGFKKLKNFLSAFDYLKLEVVDKVTYVTIIKKKENNIDISKRLIKKEFVSSTHKKEGYLSLFIPGTLYESYKEVFNNPKFENNKINHILISNLNKAIRDLTLFKIDDAYAFEIENNLNERIIGTIKKTTSKTNYDYYLNYIGVFKEKAKNEFKNKVYFENYDEAIKDLSGIANKELWCYKNSKDKYVILKIYLQYTFHHLEEQKKVLISNNKKYACFNTGLFTSNYEDIYCLLEMNNDNNSYQYNYLGFSISGIKGVGKLIVENFSPLPPKAKYYNNADEIYFDENKEIHIDYKHIILENISRFPLTFLLKVSKAFDKEYSILKEIEKNIKKPYSDSLIEKLFYKYEESLGKNEQLFNFIKASFEYALKESIKKVNYDYHLVLPSYYSTRNAISILLPISFEKDIVAQMFLLIEDTKSGNYQGQTILTLKQCYVNARLISPLTNTYLNPKDIND